MNILLLAYVLIVWGCNWPLMKLIMYLIPPLWFGFIRMTIACIFLFVWVIIQKSFIIPKRKDIGHLLSVGIFQVGLFTILVNLGLFYNAVGRTVILVYSTPLWVAPIAIIFFKERLTKLKSLGLAIGILGIVILFNPFDFDWSNYHAILASIALILASISWSIAILHVRFRTPQSTVLQLLPWQFLIGCIIIFCFAIFFDPQPKIIWTPPLIGLNLYIGIFATALTYWGAVELSKKFPAITTSLALTGVPIIGVLSSALFFHEHLTISTVLSLLLLIIGLCLVLISDYKNPPVSA